MDGSLLATIGRLAAQRRQRILLVGGAVRDWLLGRPLRDYDFVVLGESGPGNAVALARTVANALDGAVYVMDAARGTARVIIGELDGLVLDFALCRGASFDEDLRARDFTVNAIAARLPDAPGDLPRLHDPLDGEADLRARVIRMCAPGAIDDDPVRALRAVRMAAALEATILDDTWAAACAAQLAPERISAERLRDEFFKILALAQPRAPLARLDQAGLLAQIVPEAAARVEAAILPNPPADWRWPGLAAQLAALAGGDRARLTVLRFAGLLADGVAPRAALRRAEALRLSGAEARQVRITLEARAHLGDIAPATGAERDHAVYAFMRDARECAPEAAWLAHPAHPALADDMIDLYFSRYAPGVAPQPLLNGDDLLALGVPPGPRIGELLDQLREAQMLGHLHTRDDARAFLTRAAAV